MARYVTSTVASSALAAPTNQSARKLMVAVYLVNLVTMATFAMASATRIVGLPMTVM